MAVLIFSFLLWRRSSLLGNQNPNSKVISVASTKKKEYWKSETLTPSLKICFFRYSTVRDSAVLMSSVCTVDADWRKLMSCWICLKSTPMFSTTSAWLLRLDLLLLLAIGWPRSAIFLFLVLYRFHILLYNLPRQVLLIFLRGAASFGEVGVGPPRVEVFRISESFVTRPSNKKLIDSAIGSSCAFLGTFHSCSSRTWRLITSTILPTDESLSLDWFLQQFKISRVSQLLFSIRSMS